MCYSAKVSLTTFIYGCIAAILVYYLNVIPLHTIIIMMSFTIMQFIEFLTWTYYDNPTINRYLSMLSFATIVLQLILLNYYLPKKKTSRILLISLFIFAILFIIIQLKYVDFRMRRGDNKHLAWYWLDLPILWIIIGLSYYLIPTYFTKNKLGFIFTITILMTSLYYYWKYKTWGSMWCYFSNIGWVFLLGFSIIILIKPSLSSHLIANVRQ